MKETKLRQYNKLFNEIWKMFKEFSAPTDSVEFWDRLRAHGNMLTNAFEDVDKQTAETMAVAVMVAIQGIYHKNREGAA